MNERLKAEGWIGVDLDGTLAEHEIGHYDPDAVGKPIPAMLERVKRWLSEGREVKIVTARVSSDGTPAQEHEKYNALVAIERWCLQHLGQVLDVTCAKDYRMLELYDDRAVQVEFNTGRLVGASTHGFA